MVRPLLNTFGKEKINTLTKYPSILTLHSLEKGKLTDQLTTDIREEDMYATEKIDGTNVRLIFYKGEYIIGSRKDLLHFGGDLIWNPALNIVDQFYELDIPIIDTDQFTVVYGEFYGGKVTRNSKDYGTDKYSFRVFDIAIFNQRDLEILKQPIEEISKWRESTLDSSVSKQLRYGQPFVSKEVLEELCEVYGYEKVPDVDFKISDYSHQGILDAMLEALPQTKAALSENAKMGCEGLILRNLDRSKIVKIRYEDYNRALKK